MFDDFDTKVTAEEYYRSEGYDTDTIDEFVRRDTELYDNRDTAIADINKRDESLRGGKYHGPSNEPGLTHTEYWEMRDEEHREREEYLDYINER